MTATPTHPGTGTTPAARELREQISPGDRVFRLGTRSAALLVFVVMGLIGFFLLLRAQEALRRAGWSFFTTAAWQPVGGEFGVAALLLGTVSIGCIAVLIAFPLSLGTALYISEYAPRRVRGLLISLVDLMAAVPSVVYGLWGLFLLQPNLIGTSRWLADHLGWIPFFDVHNVNESSAALQPTLYTKSAFLAGIVVSLMVIPICTSVMREVFSSAPVGEREAALALGSTRWGMIRAVVLPFGRAGMIGGTMLGLGRALGETIAVYLVISAAFDVKVRVLEAGTNTVAAHIAQSFGEASPFALSALMAAGLVLFLMTLLVNVLAAFVVNRARSGALTEI